MDERKEACRASGEQIDRLAEAFVTSRIRPLRNESLEHSLRAVWSYWEALWKLGFQTLQLAHSAISQVSPNSGFISLEASTLRRMEGIKMGRFNAHRAK